MNAQNFLKREKIDPDAIGIIKDLQESGHKAYLVGGCVRDLLVKMTPKDFDIVTSAVPSQVKRATSQAYIIGKRFRLVLVKRGLKKFEVATFRREAREEDFPNGLPVGDNVFGNPEEDAQRRDFTVNALFFDPVTRKLIDYVNGLQDMNDRVIRVIGSPQVRLPEDPIRILRALRLAHKLQFHLDETLRDEIQRQARSLKTAARPRIREEILKILRLNDPGRCFLEMQDCNLFPALFPSLDMASAESWVETLRLYQHIVNDPENSLHLFVWLLTAHFEHYNFKIDRFSQEEIRQLFREELGLFKYEHEEILKVFETLNLMRRRMPHHRRSRQIVKRETFPIAFAIAETSCFLPLSLLEAWRDLKKSVEKSPAI